MLSFTPRISQGVAAGLLLLFFQMHNLPKRVLS